MKQVIATKIMKLQRNQRKLRMCFEAKIISQFAELNIRFFYYDEQQYQVSQKLQLPYVFCWLSWCIGLSHVTTKTILLHDYDALILNNHLANRYQEFIDRSAKMQGIRAYHSNGILSEYSLATTFEAFVDVTWARSFTPIKLFHDLAIYKGRSVDFDILLYLQAHHSDESERQITPVKEEDLVHPSQMIHQYTMFQKFPQKSQPCFSIVMIPFFNFLSGNQQAFRHSIDAITRDGSQAVDF